MILGWRPFVCRLCCPCVDLYFLKLEYSTYLRCVDAEYEKPPNICRGEAMFWTRYRRMSDGTTFAEGIISSVIGLCLDGWKQYICETKVFTFSASVYFQCECLHHLSQRVSDHTLKEFVIFSRQQTRLTHPGPIFKKACPVTYIIIRKNVMADWLIRNCPRFSMPTLRTPMNDRTPQFVAYPKERTSYPTYGAYEPNCVVFEYNIAGCLIPFCSTFLTISNFEHSDDRY